ncbi:MAG: hypothetical protein IJP96_06965 [Synergistaceae bacterium]|nr:hypothetical protein [Synergistaceae bacterium]
MIVGFIEKNVDDYTIWNVELNKNDAEIINSILEKYQNDGYSIRGNKDELKLSDAF